MVLQVVEKIESMRQLDIMLLEYVVRESPECVGSQGEDW